MYAERGYFESDRLLFALQLALSTQLRKGVCALLPADPLAPSGACRTPSQHSAAVVRSSARLCSGRLRAAWPARHRHWLPRITWQPVPASRRQAHSGVQGRCGGGNCVSSRLAGRR